VSGANVTPLHPTSPRKGEAPSRNTVGQRRYRKRRKAVTPPVTRNASPPPEITKQSEAVGQKVAPARLAEMLAYVSAIGLASVAALFSIRGMVTCSGGRPCSSSSWRP